MRSDKYKASFDNKKIILVGGIVLLIIMFAFFIFYNSVIILKGGNISINYGDKYKEKGYSAKLFGKDYTKGVKISNKVNLKKVGRYKVNYKVKIGFMIFSKDRVVSVVDKEKPKIILKGGKKVDVCPGTKYKELGFKVKDNYDGDITKKVKVNTQKDKVIYTVYDSSHNYTKVVRKLKYRDVTKPKISLNGDLENYIIIGNDFEDEGASAKDNCDGDISKKISSSGSVDNSKPGEYSIVYKVSDKAKNEGSVERKVYVLEKASMYSGIPGTIYLTFDDGPNSGTTDVILDILKEEGVKATFFVTNNGPDDLIKREYDEGHTVALHTATHNYSLIYSSDDNYFKDLYSVQERVKNITGETSMIFRFPGGSSNTVSRKYSPGIMSRITQSSLSKGFKYYDWNVDSDDAGSARSADVVYNNVVGGLKKDKPNMVLMHDIKPYTRDAVRNIIKFGKDNGYKFEKITMKTAMITQKVNN